MFNVAQQTFQRIWGENIINQKTTNLKNEKIGNKSKTDNCKDKNFYHFYVRKNKNQPSTFEGEENLETIIVATFNKSSQYIFNYLNIFSICIQYILNILRRSTKCNLLSLSRSYKEILNYTNKRT